MIIHEKNIFITKSQKMAKLGKISQEKIKDIYKK